MPVLWWLLTTSSAAFASEPWPEAEREAIDLIDRCRLDPGACRGETTALARAFLIRATAASLLRGELDPVATVDARLLDAALTDAWAAMLPDAHGVQPDPWVVALAAAAWASPPTESTAKKSRVLEGLGAFSGALPFDPQRRGNEASAALDARLHLDHDLAVHVGAELVTTRLAVYAEVGTEDAYFPEVEGQLVGGVGGWWTLREGGSNALTGDLTVGLEGVGKAGQAWMSAHGAASTAPTVGVGVRLDQSARLSVSPRAPLYVTVDSHLGYQHQAVSSRGRSPRVELRATFGLETVVHEHLRVGGAVVAELATFPPHVPQVEFHVGPVLRLGWVTAPRR